MELRRFQQFITLVEEGTFTAAAAKLYMAQSSLSASIAALEQELGVQLVTRSHGGIELTDAGRAFLEPARKTVADAEQAKSVAACIKHGLPPLRVADTFGVPDLTVERVAEDMLATWPGLTVDITHCGLRNVTALVAEGAVDVAFTPISRPLPGNVMAVSIRRVPIVLLVAAGHRLAGARGVTFDDVKNERIIRLPDDSALRDYTIQPVDAIVEAAPVRVTAEGWLGALSLVRRGYGVSAGPQYNTDYYPPDIATATFAEPPLMESAIVARRTGRHRALDDYIARCRAALDAET